MIRIFKILRCNCFPSTKAWIYSGLLLCLLLTNFVFSTQINDGLIVFKEIWFLMVSGLALVFLIFSGIRRTNLILKVDRVDIFVFIYFGYSLINSIVKIESRPLTFHTNVLLIGLMLTYFTVKKVVDINKTWNFICVLY